MPVVLLGEGDFSLTDVKDIKVTEEFLGLGEEITNCQTEEQRADCVTRGLRERVLSLCACAPIYLPSHFPSQVRDPIIC